MERIIKILFNGFNLVSNWLYHEGKYGRRSGNVLLLSFLIAAILNYFARSEWQQRVVVYSFLLLLFTILFFFAFDAKDKLVLFFTKGEKNNARELMKDMSHIAYLYGLVWFSILLTYFIYIILFCISSAMGIDAAWINIFTIFVIVLLTFSFLFFSYHIFISEAENHVELAKTRLQLYTAIGTTLSFVMLIFGESQLFKIILSGILLDNIWLQYFISKYKE